MKIKLFKTLIIPTATISLLPNIVACSNQHKESVDILIDSNDVVQWSNNQMVTSSPTIYYKFDLFNIKQDDVLSIKIKNQDVDHEIGHYLDVWSESRRITLDKDQESIEIPVILNLGLDFHEVLEVHFSFVCTITRSNNIILKKQFDDLYFENATPTTFDMFSYETNNDGEKVLSGWSNEGWVAKQLPLCNVLLIPNDVVEIKNEAFVKSGAVQEGETSIPENIKYIYFDQSFGHNTTISSLRKIGDDAFAQCHKSKFKNIVFPDNLNEIGARAFYGCTNFIGPVSFGLNLSIVREFAFYKCTNLSGIVCNSICSLQNDVFNECPNIDILDVTGYGDQIPDGEHGEYEWNLIGNFDTIQPQTDEHPRYVYISDPGLKPLWSEMFLSSFNYNFNSWTYTIRLE